MQNHSFDIRGSHFGFSATRIGDLGASEYTLVSIAADMSTSVGGFERDIERCIGEVVVACRQAPRADNLMLRTLAFNHSLKELHGFKPLTALSAQTYANALSAGGSTALFDAAVSSVGAQRQYAEQLTRAGFDVNGIAIVITDGCDNASSARAHDVNDIVKSALADEALESLLTILVGVNIASPDVSTALKQLEKDGGFDRYIELDSADAATLAKLAAFVTRSISLQSLALGRGSGSIKLTF